MHAGSKRLVRIILKTLLVLLVFNFAFPLLEAVRYNDCQSISDLSRKTATAFGETPELAYNPH
jgi:hypothetical protein